MKSLSESIISSNNASIISVAYDWLFEHWVDNSFVNKITIKQTPKGIVIDGSLNLDYKEPYPYSDEVKLIPGKKLKIHIGGFAWDEEKKWDKFDLSKILSKDQPFELSLYSSVPDWLYDLNLSRFVIGTGIDMKKLDLDKLNKNTKLEFNASSARNALSKLLNRDVIVK